MSVYEVHAQQARCDRCNAVSDTYFTPFYLHPPDGWGFATRRAETDDTYAPTEYRILLCPDCLGKEVAA